jgi:hypothetical protein
MIEIDYEWLREWATGEVEYPPRNIRVQVGALLDVLETMAPPPRSPWAVSDHYDKGAGQ